jgi:hypothetical protein
MIYYRFYIDGIEIPEPGSIGGWEKLITNIRRDSSELKGVLVSQDVELTFIGDQYKFFRDAYFNLGICSEFRTLIQKSYDKVNYSALHRGLIKLRDVVLKDMIIGTCTAKINDDSFYARIDNNKSISSNPKAVSSKNGQPIPACPDYATALYTCANGNFAATRNFLSVYDVMEHLVRFMSDDEVSFRSDFLQSNLTMVIQQGSVIRTDADTSPYWEVSFAKLFDDISKLRKIGWQIEYGLDEKPIFRLELAEFFYSQTPATDHQGNEIIFKDPEKIETSINASELYGKLRIGSETIDDSAFLSYPENIRFNGFKKEEFYILGQCNIDNALDLTKDIVISSNVIENIVDGASEDYDDKLILIVVDAIDHSALTANAKMTNPSGPTPPTFYNMDLRNSQVAQNYFNTFQGGLVAGFLNFTPNDFSGYITANQSTPIPAPFGTIDLNPIIYSSEVDPGNNFNPVTGYYTCPITGYYTFNFFCSMDIPGVIVGAFIGGFFNFRIVDDSGNILAEDSINNQNNIGPNLSYGLQYTGVISASIFRNAGDRVGTAINYTYGVGYLNVSFRLLTGTYFSATSTPDGGGVVADYDAEDIRNVLIKFKYNISERLFDSIKNQLTKQYCINSTVLKKTYKGWIESMKHRHKDGSTDIVIKTSIRTINPGIETNPIKRPAYRWIYSMTDANDSIQGLDYNDGLSSAFFSPEIILNDTVENITHKLEDALLAIPVTFFEIIITKTQIAGALYRFVITIVYPNSALTAMQIGEMGVGSTPSSFLYY